MSDNSGNIRQLHLLSGSLVSEADKPVPYWPVEISQYSFSALTDSQLKGGEAVKLKTPASSARLKVTEVQGQYRGTGYYLVRFETSDINTNLEQELRQVPELKRWNPADLTGEPIKLPFANLHVRAARFDTPDQLRIHARTFGTRGDFVMHTENVSKSGMLIREHQETAPFSLNTILELTIDPECKQFEEPVRCLAKIVRHENLGSGSRYGIQLIEMSQATQGVWAGFVEALERALVGE